MAIDLASVIIKHERRAQLVFTAALAAGAFASTSYYSVTSLGGGGSSPTVVAVYLVAGSTSVVELALSVDLTPGVSYSFAAVAVPAADASTTPDPSTAVAVFGQPTKAPTAQQKGGNSELERLLYGEDVVFANGDFVEGPGGDLATVSGAANLSGALYRRLFSDGLPWDDKYGLKPREYVDGTPGGMLSIRARAEEQLRADDRVATATVQVVIDNPNSQAFVLADVSPTGVGDLAKLKVPVALA